MRIRFRRKKNQSSEIPAKSKEIRLNSYDKCMENTLIPYFSLDPSICKIIKLIRFKKKYIKRIKIVIYI